MIKLRSAMVLPLVAALTAACSKTPEPTATSAPEAPATSKPAAPAEAAPAPKPAPASGQQAGGALAWDAPASFESAPNPNSMRKATYKIKRAAGDAEDAELSVSQAGGSVDANITRWAGQFSQKSDDSPKRTDLKAGDLKVTIVEVKGTFAGSGMPGMPASDPKPNYALLGAIVETPSGDPWFFKMTGPEKTVTGARADFDKLVNSLRVK
ncbi:hypothetical protein WME95_24340 [Sorangium sp. So ce327]|jgi:hypothetical protein|uniref:hypothetical protein n=1 Tax=unclassified Sorangium TaxID=2621164 RepID=UPI003F603967